MLRNTDVARSADRGGEQPKNKNSQRGQENADNLRNQIAPPGFTTRLASTGEAVDEVTMRDGTRYTIFHKTGRIERRLPHGGVEPLSATVVPHSIVRHANEIAIAIKKSPEVYKEALQRSLDSREAGPVSVSMARTADEAIAKSLLDLISAAAPQRQTDNRLPQETSSHAGLKNLQMKWHRFLLHAFGRMTDSYEHSPDCNTIVFEGAQYSPGAYLVECVKRSEQGRYSRNAQAEEQLRQAYSDMSALQRMGYRGWFSSLCALSAVDGHLVLADLSHLKP
jgi:hypothetical protein